MTDGAAAVTGGSSGLGFALAERLVADGRTVFVLGRDRRRLEDAAGRLAGEGADVRGIPCDISDEGHVRGAFDEIGRSGPLSFLFNVAGVGRFGPAEDLTTRMVEDVLAANLTGLMLVTAAALPLLRASGGTIVSVLSSAALVGRPHQAVYCAAKWGARGFMEALRAELRGTGLRTLTVYPGGMRTPFWSADAGLAPDLSTYMDPGDVAAQILRVALDPGTAHVTEMSIAR